MDNDFFLYIAAELFSREFYLNEYSNKGFIKRNVDFCC